MSARLDPESRILLVDETVLNEVRIDGMELFEIDVDTGFDAAEGTLTICRCGILRIVCGANTGWGSCILSTADNRFDIVKWASFLHRLKPMTIGEALEAAERQRVLWGACKSDLVLEALRDLRSRLGNKRIGNGEELAVIMKRATAYYSVLH